MNSNKKIAIEIIYYLIKNILFYSILALSLYLCHIFEFVYGTIIIIVLQIINSIYRIREIIKEYKIKD